MSFHVESVATSPLRAGNISPPPSNSWKRPMNLLYFMDRTFMTELQEIYLFLPFLEFPGKSANVARRKNIDGSTCCACPRHFCYGLIYQSSSFMHHMCLFAWSHDVGSFPHDTCDLIITLPDLLSTDFHSSPRMEVTAMAITHHIPPGPRKHRDYYFPYDCMYKTRNRDIPSLWQPGIHLSSH